MRLLFVTNYYPPHYVGGYELLCDRAARWLVDAGHTVRVLASDFRLNDAGDESPIDVRRVLELRYWTDVTDLGYWLRERRDVAAFRAQVREFCPDIVGLWNVAKLASGIVMAAQRSPRPTVYHLYDDWLARFRSWNGLPQFWARPARSTWARVAKPPLRRLYRALLTDDVASWWPRHAVLATNNLRERLGREGITFDKSHVAHVSYDPQRFAPRDPAGPAGGAVRFLWAGRLCRGKGIVTMLDALDTLWRRRPDGWMVDFCGPTDPEDEDLFRPRLASAPWSGRVRYLGALPHDDMPTQYADHDAFLFTSEVHEGLPTTLVEAFACALPVIGTLTGGTHDLLRPDENCLVYPMGDAGALARAMQTMVDDAPLRGRFSERAARFAGEHLSNDVVFAGLETFYREIVQA